MFNYDYMLFLVSQALSELGDHLWSLGLRNFMFENSPWTPAAGLAAVFILQAIPVFLMGPWITSRIGQKWRTTAIFADLFRMSVTILFAAILIINGNKFTSLETIFILLTVQFFLEAGSILFQNCRNCLIPLLYPNPSDIPQAHLWANLSSLTAAGIVPLIFIFVLPAQEKIQIQWLIWAAGIDALSFAISAGSLVALKRSRKMREFENNVEQSYAPNFREQFANGIKTIRKYPKVYQLLSFSFLYNILLMGPFEIGHVTFLRQDLGLPPASLAVNLILFISGISLGTLVANKTWRKGQANHFRRFSISIFWDGITFFPICIFALFRKSMSNEFFLTGLSALFLFHYALVPFVKVSRLAGIQTIVEKKDWSTILGFHTIAVEGAGALSVVFVALAYPNMSGTHLLAIGGLGATLCGAVGLSLLKTANPRDLKS